MTPRGLGQFALMAVCREDRRLGRQHRLQDALGAGQIRRGQVEGFDAAQFLDAVAGFTGTKEIGARGQFRNMQLLRTLPDYLQIWPGHGAGSACGKGLGAIPSSTLGYEKLFNPAFQIDDEDAFVEWLLEGQPEAPRYFAQMKTVNKLGPALLNTLPDPARLPANVLTDALAAGHLVIDTRPGDAFARQHIPGTVHIPASEQSFS
ncbi:MAG: hypothetical protein JNM70_20185, partial [Anaerolineae bacterium]|nr:hypothetical protein [Anaerolineae bacterium]